MEDTYILEMSHIVKTFPGVRALGDGCLRLKKGETHALIGENGAGKSCWAITRQTPARSSIRERESPFPVQTRRITPVFA